MSSNIPIPKLIDALDRRSRKEALPLADSLLLEEAIVAESKGQRHIRVRARTAARLGVKRDMGVFGR